MAEKLIGASKQPSGMIIGWTNRELRSLLVAAFLVRASYVVLPFLTTFLVSARGESADMAATAFSAMGAGGLAGALLAGPLSDRLGVRNCLVGGLSAAALVSLIIPRVAALNKEAMVLVLSFALGFLLDGYRPVASAAVGLSVSGADRTRAFGLVTWAAMAGGAVGPLVGGFLSRQNWEYVFGQQCIGALAAAAVLFVALRHAAFRGQAKPKVTGYLETLNRGKYLLAALFLFSVVTAQLLSTFPIILTDSGFSASQYGIALTVNSFAAMIFILPFTAFAAKAPAHFLMAGCALMVAVGTGLLAAPIVTPLALAYVLAIGLSSAVMFSVGPSAASALALPSHMGAMHSLFGTSVASGMVIGPLVGGWVLQGFGLRAFVVTVAAAGAVAAFLFLRCSIPRE